jgi:hypothetical protein
MKKIVLVTIFAITCIWNASAQEARFAELSGKVEVKTGGDWKPAAVGALIGKNSIISTGIKSTAVISLGNSRISINPLTMLTLEELIQRNDTEETVLFLRTGSINADVTPPSGQKAEFTVRSPTTTASVRGTSFWFNGQRLSVQSGKVAFANRNGQKVYIKENQYSYANSGLNQRPVTPFEAESSRIRPVLNDLPQTGSGRESLGEQAPKFDITINADWI